MAENTSQRVQRMVRGKQKREQALAKLVDDLVSNGSSPLDYMIGILREPPPEPLPSEAPIAFARRLRLDKELRLEAAKAAAPYIHARAIKSVDITHRHENQAIDVTELARDLSFLFAITKQEREKPIELPMPAIEQLQ